MRGQLGLRVRVQGLMYSELCVDRHLGFGAFRVTCGWVFNVFELPVGGVL